MEESESISAENISNFPETSNDVVLTVERVLNHEESVFSILCFGYPLYVLVSCSADSTIRIWDLRTGEILKIINKHVGFVNDVVKWSNNSFISCGEDGKMYCISAQSPFKILKKFELSSVGIQTALKVSDDEFILVNNNAELLLNSFSKNEVVKKLRNQRIHFYPVLIKSEFSNLNCIYLNVHGRENPIRLIDYESDEVITEMKTKENSSPIYSIQIITDRSGNEILCSGNSTSTVFLYNMGGSDTNKSDLQNKTVKCFKKIVLHESEGKELSFTTRLLCMTPVCNQYLFVGDSKKTLSVIDLESYRKIHSEPIIHHEEQATVMEIQYLIDFNRQSESNIKVVCCSSESSIQVFGTNLNFKNSFFKIFNQQIYDLFIHKVEEESEYRVKKPMSRKELESIYDDILQKSYSLFLLENQEISKSDEFEVNLFTNPFSSSTKDDRMIYVGQLNNSNIAEGKGILFHKRKKERNKNLLMNKITFKKKSEDFIVRYIGHFKSGEKNGIGKLYSTRSPYLIDYQGEFLSGKKEGRGMEFDNNNSNLPSSLGSPPIPVFEGVFKNNVKEGRGYLYDKETGEYIKGTWRNGVLEEGNLKNIFRFKCPIIPYEEIHSIKKHLNETTALGSGGFGQVYRIKSSLIPSLSRVSNSCKKGENEDVAIKIIKTGNDINVRMEMYYRMKRGVELCQTLDDQSHMLETFGVFQGVSDVGSIMRLCECDISSLLVPHHPQTLSIQEKERILYETCKGISEFARQGLMHRDLKWGNVLRDFNGDIKLTDFDCTKEDQGKIKLTLDSQTKEIGTPFYQAPEVIFEKKYRSIHGEDFRYGVECDVFSYGIMMYSMLMDTNHPFHSQIRCSCGIELKSNNLITEIYSHIFKCKLRPLLDGSKLSKYPTYLIDLMIQCWSNNPFKRPKMEDIVQIFEYERRKNKSRKNYSVFKFVFPKYERILEPDSMLLLNTSTNLMEKIINFLESKISKKFVKERKAKTKKIKIKSLVHKIFGVVYSDEDILKIVEKENCPVLEVEFGDNFFEIAKERKLVPQQRKLESEVKLLKDQLRIEREFVGGLFDEVGVLIKSDDNFFQDEEKKERLMSLIQEKEKEYRSLVDRGIQEVGDEKEKNDEECEGEGEV